MGPHLGIAEYGACPDGTTVKTAASNQATDAYHEGGDGGVPLAMVTHRGQSARFAAVIEPVATGHRPAVTALNLEANDGMMQIIVQNDRGLDIFTLSGDTLGFRRSETPAYGRP